jgi:hypothetical protein
MVSANFHIGVRMETAINPTVNPMAISRNGSITEEILLKVLVTDFS